MSTITAADLFTTGDPLEDYLRREGQVRPEHQEDVRRMMEASHEQWLFAEFSAWHRPRLLVRHSPEYEAALQRILDNAQPWTGYDSFEGLAWAVGQKEPRLTADGKLIT